MIWIRNAGTCRWYGCDMARNVAVACYCEFASQERSSSHCAERCSTRPRPRWTSVVFHLRLSSGRGARSWGSKVGEVVRKEETEGGGPFSADGSTDAVEGSWTFAGYFGTFCSKAGIMTSAVICPHHLIQWRPMVIKHYSPNLVDFNVWVYDIVCTLGSWKAPQQVLFDILWSCRHLRMMLFFFLFLARKAPVTPLGVLELREHGLQPLHGHLSVTQEQLELLRHVQSGVWCQHRINKRPHPSRSSRSTGFEIGGIGDHIPSIKVMTWWWMMVDRILCEHWSMCEGCHLWACKC